jgi:predicted Rossmann fold nucleotide-binding protein DprA/Smf involved in DNA uptake
MSKSIVIIGSRRFTKSEAVKIIYRILMSEKPILIVSGGRQGPDTIAEKMASLSSFNIQTKIFPADWNRLGKQADSLRNIDIIEACDEVFVLWDGKSKGILNSILIAIKQGKKVTIYPPRINDETIS